MFICRDITERYLLSVYWEQNELFVVVKEVAANGELTEQSAVRYTQQAARELMHEMSNGSGEFHGVRIDALTTVAIVGRIAEGLRDESKRSPKSRLSPEMWN